MADEKPTTAVARPGSDTSSDVESTRRLDDDQVPAGFRPPRTTWILILCGLFSGGILFGLDTTIAADVQGSVYEAFGQIEKLPWVGIGFPMGSVAVLLLVGKLFGSFQVKWLMVAFFALFELGSLVCATAPSLDALIVGRVIAGVGGAGMYLGALNYVGVFTTERERPLYNAGIGLCWGIGAILGPVVGGAFSVNPHATWRWAFYINLPLAAAQAPIFLFAFPRYNPKPDQATLAKLKELDWVGALLNACTFVFLIVALSFSGSTWPWSAPGPIAFWVLFGVSAGLYALQQSLAVFTTPARRLFPVHFLASRTLVLVYLATAAAATAAGTTIYYIPLLFQFTKGDSAIQAAVRLLPMIVTYVVFMMLAGALLPLVGRHAPFYALGGALILAGGAAMFTATPATPAAHIYGFEILIGAGAGLTFQAGYAVAGTRVAKPDLPAAIGFVNVAQIGSTAIALSLAGCIFQNVGLANLKAALAAYPVSEDMLRAALGGAQSSLHAAPADFQERAIAALVHTVADDFGLVMAAGALMLVCSLLFRWDKLSFDKAAAGGA